MIVTAGLGSIYLITQGYGGPYIPPAPVIISGTAFPRKRRVKPLISSRLKRGLAEWLQTKIEE